MKIYSKITSKIHPPKSFKSIPGSLEPRFDHFAKGFPFRNKHFDKGLQNQILTLLEAETKTLDLHFENIEPKPILVLIVLSVPLDLLHEKIRLGSTL